MSYTIVNKNNIEYLKTQPDDCFDSIVTDPPYGIEFLAKDWDSNTGALETWQECLRTLKPGGYLLAFSAARTYHQLATNIEQAGFEIRDQIMWIYASGFPKAQDIGKAIQKRQGVKETKPQDGMNAFGSGGANIRMNPSIEKEYTDKKADIIPTSPEAQQWAGWKTALKPAHEPIVMARKPFKGSAIDNVLKHGVGALNIDDSRVAYEGVKDQKSANGFDTKYDALDRSGGPTFQKDKPSGGANGFSRLEFGEREPAKFKDQYSEYSFGAPGTGAKQDNLPPKFHPDEKGRFPSNVLGEIPDYQKYFYCPKVSRKERHCGFEQDPITTEQMVAEMGGKITGNNRIWTPDLGEFYIHGLKHEYEKWCKKNKDPLAHIETGNNFGDALKGDGEMWGKHQSKNVGNNHPTVKPVALMKYLIKLVTPPNSRVLDPFCGSGSTGMAAVELGHEFVGCDLDPNYVDISNRRIAGWLKTNGEPAEPNLPKDVWSGWIRLGVC